MAMLLFLIGVLLGIVVGAAFCVRYLKQEMTARIGPSMEILRMQLDNVQNAMNLMLGNWHNDLRDQVTPLPRAVAARRDGAGEDARQDRAG